MYNVKENLETGKFDIYKQGVGLIISCTTYIATQQVIAALEKDEQREKEIQKFASELNNIKEPDRDRSFRTIFPANDNSILNSPLARATRELLGKTK